MSVKQTKLNYWSMKIAFTIVKMYSFLTIGFITKKDLK